MQGRFLGVAALAAVICSFALAPRAALAHGNQVAMKETFAPGTIVVRTSERALY